MVDSREESPDWLRSFQLRDLNLDQFKLLFTVLLGGGRFKYMYIVLEHISVRAPAEITLSSGSESPVNNNHLSDDEDSINLSKLFQKDKTSLSEDKSSQDGHGSQLPKTSEVNSPIQNEKVDRTSTRKRKKENQSEKKGKGTNKALTKRRALEKPFTDKEPGHSICTLSSDSESPHDGNSMKVEEVLDKELLMHDAKATKKEENGKEEQEKKIKLENPLNEGIEKEDMEAMEKNITEKQSGTNLSSSRLPLVLPEKVQRTKALVECEGDSVDLSGDVGAVGRIIVSDGPSGNHEMLLDLKGTIYKTTILPSRTFCVVSFGPSEAKVEAIMSDFIQLKSQSNAYDAETMIEGTLDGFTFDSDEEAENLTRPASQGDQNENVDHQTNGNVKAKAKKASAMEQKKGKKGAKIPKKVKKKPQVQKKSKSKK
ncbi:hypothetical protein H5410_017226 [Solanum commersonii]|uniref:DNA-binding protein BIN4 n=1 Tax=Solanum commersonii TaxID=4109 RepID=A0A9J5ZZF5_SOLCO|nr:hypothetical protein H5410_017226 [Solanum commersonii]